MSFSAAHNVNAYMAPLPVASNELAEPLATTFDAKILWQRIEHILANGRELRVAYLLFHCGLTPNEIVHRCPQEFTDLQEIATLRCSIMKKLISHI